MLILVYFTLGFAVSCGVLVYGYSWWIALAGAAFLPVLLSVLAWDSSVLSKGKVLLIGAVAGIVWYGGYKALYLNPAINLDEQTQEVVIRATDFSYETEYGSALDGRIRVMDREYQVRVYLDGEVSISPGTEICGLFRFRITTPDGAEEMTHHAGKGIFLLAYQEDTITIREVELTWREKIAILRREIKNTLRGSFSEDTYPFAKALLLGDCSDLGYDLDTDLKLSGIRHVVAVSGLHVSIIFGVIGLLTLRRRFLSVIVGLPLLFFFGALSGFTPSVTRACMMSALMLGAQLLDKEYDGPTALAFAALVMLLLNPLSVASVSLQLSVGSVAGIFLFHPPVQKWIFSLFGDCNGKRWKKKVASALSSTWAVSLSAMAVTTPLCAFYFGTVSLVGILTNFLTLWVISAIFGGLMAVCLLGWIVPSAAGMIAGILSWPIRYVLWIADTMANLPMAAVYTCSFYVTFWLVFVYILLAVFLLGKGRSPKILICCATLGFCCAVFAGWAVPWADEVRFTMLDVGQGQSLLLQSEGKTFLVDCGGTLDGDTADLVAETLIIQGVDTLDGMILTHLDQDHAGAAGNLLSRIDTRLLILPSVYSTLANQTDGEVIYADRDLQLSFGKTNLQIYSPTYPGTGNENSLCILFDTEKCDILITGDRNAFGERMLLRNADIPDVDILVAGHHGAAGSTCEELLNVARPEIVCISAGRDNIYGHPSPVLLERLSQYGCTVYRTDQSGTITIRR